MENNNNNNNQFTGQQPPNYVNNQQGFNNTQAQPQVYTSNQAPPQDYTNTQPQPQAYAPPQQNYANNQPPTQDYANTQPAYDNDEQPPQIFGSNPQYTPDQKVPYTNDMKHPDGPGSSSQAAAEYSQNANAPGYGDNSKNPNVPGYGVNINGMTPMQKEQQQMKQQMEQAKKTGGYPGVVGGTPAESKGISGYDAQGNPIIPPAIAQRHQIEQSLGPTCKDGGYHDLRMLLTTSSLLFAVLIIPYCCGYRGKRVVKSNFFLHEFYLKV